MPPPACKEFQIGWICALPIEVAAAKEMLDENFGILDDQDSNDTNSYTLGRIGKHYVAIAGLGQYGTTSATTVAINMTRTFSQSLRIGLMVGIAAGIPSLRHDIRLGDIIVSYPDGTCGGVIQYDMGKMVNGKLTQTGSRKSPPRSLLTALTNLQASALTDDPKYPTYIKKAMSRNERTQKNFGRPDVSTDRLFKEEDRNPREDIDPQTHYGIIASGNMVIKHGETRERLRQETKALYFEMEAASLMMDFPCIVVRGICDYADSHKNDAWQGYAALAAASYAKELLSYVPAGHVSREKLVIEMYHQISDATEELQRGFQQREAHDREKIAKDEEKEKRECHQTFKTSTYEQYKNINPNRNPHYHHWRQSRHNDLLWISADPGCGKSVLSKSLVDGDLDTSDSVSICYFFFKDNDDQNSFTTALCAILHQLFGMQPDLLRHALPEWRKNGKNIQQEVSDDEFSNTICAKLIKLLATFYTQSRSLTRPNWIKFLVTSRPYLEIMEGFHPATKLFPRIHIRGEEENEQIHDEINLIVKLRVRELGEIEGLKTQTLQRIEKQLLQMENRTYLWLQLVMDDIRIMLRDSLRPEEEMIQLIPSSVSAAYEKILSHAPPARQLEVKMILQIIVGARRVGLEIASSADLRSAATSALKVEGFAKKIRHLCGLFIFINNSKRIFLIHQTAREFLINVSTNDTRFPAAPNVQFQDIVSDRARKWYHTTLIEANLLLFKVCLAYLTTGELNKGRQAVYRKNDRGYLDADDYKVGRLLSEYLFLGYSFYQWPNHAVAISSGPPKDLSDLAIKLNIAPILRDLWLIQAVKNGQRDMIKMLLANGANVDIQDSQGRTPLSVAAGLGEADMVKLLITLGADINVLAGRHGRTVLQEAVSSQEVAMVNLLFELDADIEVKERNSSASALWLATDWGLEAMVKLLIKLGANTEAKDGKWGLTPLSRAVKTAQGTMAKLLIEMGADIEAKDLKWGMTPLSLAAFNSHEGMVMLLIELHADIESKDEQYGMPPLWWAVLARHEFMVLLLNKWGSTILSWAAGLDGREGMVRLLVDIGCTDGRE
ncbi:hypothetical protein J3F84DRAFT_407691 [Trichoderma pleuroticola]